MMMMERSTLKMDQYETLAPEGRGEQKAEWVERGYVQATADLVRPIKNYSSKKNVNAWYLLRWIGLCEVR